MHGFSGINAQNERFMCTHGAEYAEVESDVDECYAYQNEQLSRTS